MIYPFSDDLDCNFGQDVGICHLRGYRIGGVLSSVGMKLENVLFICGWMGRWITLFETFEGFSLDIMMEMTDDYFFVSFLSTLAMVLMRISGYCVVLIMYCNSKCVTL